MLEPHWFLRENPTPLALGPEGRPSKISPARKGWESIPSACPGLPWERRRCGTFMVLYMTHTSNGHFELYRYPNLIPMIGRGNTLSNKINPTVSAVKSHKINNLRIVSQKTDGGFRDPGISHINNY